MAATLYRDVRKGMVIIEGGELCLVVDYELRTPGNLPAKLRLRLKNLKTGLVNWERVHPDSKVDTAFLDKRPMQYSYKDGDNYVFMDSETFEQIELSEETVGAQMVYLKENDEIQITFHEGTPLSVELPATVELEVTHTEPAIKGATAAAQTKPATLETGIEIQVPPFVEIGDVVVLNTDTGAYKERRKG
ncbi:MAG: elongation factor P [Gemmataceae bacterium]